MKKVTMLLLICLVVFAVGSVVYAATGDTNVSLPIGTNGSSSIMKTTLSRTWATITVVVQVLSMGCIVFAGVRYMFASADKKADIKRGLTMLVIGSILVFATSTITGYFVNVANQIIINN